MYCSNCGKEVNENAVVCIHCGCAVTSLKNNVAVQPDNDNGGIGWWLIGFFIPILGALLFLFFLGNRPKSAKKAGQGALMSLVLPLTILSIIGWIETGEPVVFFLTVLICFSIISLTSTKKNKTK